MWFDFVITVALCAAFLYLPGCLLLRGAGFSWLAAIPFAAVLDVTAYSLLAIVYAKVGIASSWATLGIPVAVIGAALLVLRLARCCSSPADLFDFISRADAGEAHGRSLSNSRWLQPSSLVLYVVVGIAVSALVYGTSMATPDAFVQEYDNLHHLGTTYSYLQWGNWSSLENTIYSSPADDAYDPFGYSSYYPSGWNCIAAMAAQISGVSASAANNAMNFATTAFVLPISSHCFMRTAFADRPSVVPFGAFVCTAFTAFPWAMLIFGPLYPNMLGFSLLPVLMAAFMAVFRMSARRSDRVAMAALFVLGVASCAFTQPNAVFAAAALLIAFCVSRISEWIDSLGLCRSRRIARKLLLCVGFVVLAAAAWVALFNLPFLKGVTSYYWPPLRSPMEAVDDVLTLSYRLDSPQYALAALVLVGAAVTLFRRRYLWMTVSWLFVAVIYITDAAYDGVIKQLLSSFWYSDSLRVASLSAIAAMPLAALGLWAAAKALSAAVRKSAEAISRCGSSAPCRSGRLHGAVAVVASLAIAALAFAMVFRPDAILSRSLDGTGAFTHMISNLDWMCDTDRDDVYDPDECAFVQKVKEVLPEGALVVNVPDDGSAFAYAVDDLKVMYCYLGGYGGADEKGDSKFIRDGLANIARSYGVRQAVRATGAEYVLLLDQGGQSYSSRERRYLFTYSDGQNWQGILSITDETPGFEVVLSQDDMRLYRITALD